ncbi:hypothetical protein Tco_0283161 [Tanacetum coccineum]
MVLPGCSCVHRLHSEDFLTCLGDDLEFLHELVLDYFEASEEQSAVYPICFFVKFRNLSTRLSKFSFQIVKILLYDHPAISETFYFVFYVLNAVKSREDDPVMTSFLKCQELPGRKEFLRLNIG